MKRRNRKLRKALLMTCCALALVAISIGATLAYLTDTEAVTNVFTVGQVGISLDEAKVDAEGQTVEAERVQENSYHLIPSKNYDKDPTVHVDAKSEDSWIFVKVENGIELIEDKADYINTSGEEAVGTIAEQIEAFGWTKLVLGDNEDSDIYYKAHSKSEDVEDYVVFKNFKISGKAHNRPPVSIGADGYDENALALVNFANEEVTVTAYAIQMAGFKDDAAGAWAAGKFGETTNP